MEINGYTTKTTFWQDFSIADETDILGNKKEPNENRYDKKYGAIEDTYKRAFEEWKTNTEYLTELVMVLNWKCWQFFEKGCLGISKLYQELFEQADNYAIENLKGKDLEYFLETTD